MKIKPFAVEEWMNAYETGAKYNIAETCVDSVSIDELFELCGEDKDAFWRSFSSRRMTYGDIEGAPEFKRGICRLYRTVKPEEIVTTHGASGANHHLFYSLLEPGDRVISIVPSYQQLYSIPESYGAQLHLLHLEAGNGYQPDLEQLRALAVPGTRLICLSNPNNPTGALMGPDTLREIVEIAGNAGAYVLCDEVYRHLTQDDGWSESIVDLYDKGISVSSMSKVFSLAGCAWLDRHPRRRAGEGPALPPRLQPHKLRHVRRGPGRRGARPQRQAARTQPRHSPPQPRAPLRLGGLTAAH